MNESFSYLFSPSSHFIQEKTMKFIAYWNGNIPAITKLFFSSFLATQRGELELYIENCSDIGTAKDFLKSQRVKVQEINLKELSKNTIFEKFFTKREQNKFDKLVIKIYNKYFRIKSDLYKKFFPNQILRYASYLTHPIMGFTQTSKPIIEIPFYGSVKDKFDFTYSADIFRLLMCVLKKESFVYVDLDICFLKDFASLYEQGDFVYEWEYQKFANNAIIFSSENGILKKNMTALIEKYDTVRPWFIFSKEEPLISKLRILPCELFDPVWKKDISFDSFFEDDLVMDILNNSYAYHWHNHWNTKPKDGSSYAYLMERFALEKLDP